MRPVVVHGIATSVYVRIVLLVLEEKACPYRLLPADPFAPEGLPEAFRSLNSFGRIPVVDVDGFVIYETGAVTRFLDRVLGPPPLQPADIRHLARMDQAIAILDAHAYRCLVWDLYVAHRKGQADGDGPGAVPPGAMAHAERCLDALEAILGDAPFLAGTEEPTLADHHAAPMIHYALAVPGFRTAFLLRAGLASWWKRIADRPSVARICFHPSLEGTRA